MNDYIFLMHYDAPARRDGDGADWATYLDKLKGAGVFQGGSSVGDGVCVSKSGAAPGITAHIVGYIKVRADSMDAARDLVLGNPVYEAGGTVEIRKLPNN
jgi:YCII-related domain